MPPLTDSKPALADSGVALNIADLLRHEPAILRMLVGDKLDRAPIRMDRERPDEAAALLRCDALTAACVADTIREHDRRAGDSPTRVYLRRKAWSKLPSAAVLSVVVEGRPELNPEWFRVESEAVESAPPGSVAVQF